MKKSLASKMIFFIALMSGIGLSQRSQAASPPGAYCATIPTGCQLLNVEVYPMTPVAAVGGGAGSGGTVEAVVSSPKVLVIKKYCNNGVFGISHMQIEGAQTIGAINSYNGTRTKDNHSAGGAYTPGAFSCP